MLLAKNFAFCPELVEGLLFCHSERSETQSRNRLPVVPPKDKGSLRFGLSEIEAFGQDDTIFRF